ncbi:MAG: AtpZ/AtpI family protein [Candidatus Dadabacteria bacterium]|nr:AtpZ/AtpI family protein [Candidatus Dadabacteria bacterium]
MDRGIKVRKQKKYKWLVFIAIGFELGFSVIAGIVLGQYADKWLETETPWFTIIGLIVGMVAGFSLLLRMIKRVNGRKDRESN